MKMNRTCKCCKGTGQVELETCISEMDIPTWHSKADELAELQRDAVKCKEDHARLIEINSKAKDSYDSQLEKTIANLNEQAEAIYQHKN